MLFIRHATLITLEEQISDGAILIDGPRIAALGPADQLKAPRDAEILDAEGRLLTPGLIDLQINGAFGHDFTADPSCIWMVAEGLPRYGVTAFLPTIVTSPLETTAAAREVLRQGPPAGFKGALPLGLHFEGPFLNPEKRGAHDPRYLRAPDLDAVSEWTVENGVRMVTLAPELRGAETVIRALNDGGVVVSAGHSAATFEEAEAAFTVGVRYGTHLLNAMPPLGHRAPGLAGALLADPRPVVGLIPDGVHLHPAIVALAWRSKGPTGLNLVTDAMAALGMPPGHYPLGDRDVIVDGNSARLADGRLAGSVLSLDRAVRNLIEFTGCPPREAFGAVTTVPANLLRLRARGRIAPNAAADLALFTADLDVALTIAGGEIVYRKPEGEN